MRKVKECGRKGGRKWKEVRRKKEEKRKDNMKEERKVGGRKEGMMDES